MPARSGITEFVRAHLSLSNDEIVAAAKASGQSYDAMRVRRARWKVENLSPKSKRREAASAPRQARKKQQQPSAAPTGHELKLGQLRRLIFELGFDAARAIFDEFDHAHQRMKSGRET
jgi:hypothetical protein